jgi:hypothetical protein
LESSQNNSCNYARHGFCSLKYLGDYGSKSVFTHAPHALENYYDERVFGILQKIIKVKINETGQVMDAQGLIE